MYYMMPFRGFGTAEEISLEENAAIPADDILLDEFLPEEPREVILPPETSNDEDVVRDEVTAEKWMLPASLAIQIFSIVPGIAGGVTGFVLAQKLAQAKSVKATEVLLASGAVALITFLSIFLVRTIDEFE
jgi:hypothetical protein